VNHPGSAASCDRDHSAATAPKLAQIEHAIEHAAHFLPTQAPISVFVHHNTLHAFEARPFHEAVQLGSRFFRCQAYLPEHRYRQELARGRILASDISAVLLEDLDDEADRLIGCLATRFQLRLAMLKHPVRLGSDEELQWLLAESDVLEKFCPESTPGTRDQMIQRTRQWVLRELSDGHDSPEPVARAISSLFERFDRREIEQWTDATWEAFTLRLLWHSALDGVLANFASVRDHSSRREPWASPHAIAERMVNEEMIRFSAAFLDQGFARWRLPHRDEGYFRCWYELNRAKRPFEAWLASLPAELDRIHRESLTPLDIIDESIEAFHVAEGQREEFITRSLLALPGWAGMLWQMETNAEWAIEPAPRGTLVDYLAVRLLLERLALAHITAAAQSNSHGHAASPIQFESTSPLQRAYLVFRLAQIVGWRPSDLFHLSGQEWRLLLREIDLFSLPERQRIYHLAYERHYRNQLLDGLLAHARHEPHTPETPRFQVITCLDEREESFRRHLEEVAPDCETFGAAGFFSVAMYYRGAADANYVPLCPVVIKPQHYVEEEVAYSFSDSHRRRSGTRRVLGHASHRLHVGTRTGIGGMLTALAGSLASIPLVFRVLFPLLTARIRQLLGSFVETPPVTRLHLERHDEQPGPSNGGLGYSLNEMVDMAERLLRDIGLTRNFSRLVILLGHGSSSVNNPHQSAYDCGACGGGHGGPNARAMASILGDPRVRERLRDRGIDIPRTTFFLGGMHNTGNDHIGYFDLDRLPTSHHDDFDFAREALEVTRHRNAQERCRRFESAPLNISAPAALRHVEGRTEDLSQVRAELGHATNATCIVGRRSRTRGLFLDRRAFLTSYDPTQDNENSEILSRILQAVFPVCAGINLEYYFSYVDSAGYGCGSKLPHNITSLVGVMDGAASDLRPGLPWQMVEIHEPIRILFVIETTPAALISILERNPPLMQLVLNEWVQLATLDPHADRIQLFRRGRFEPYHPESEDLPQVRASIDWFRGWRDHLGLASIVPAASSPQGSAPKDRA
jgi:uncharacterized protein YbcC (UPF0753/DUF2309 family)